jgi:hypothetical protein
MADLEKFRKRQHDTLLHLIAHPGMYGSSELEILGFGLLSDLAELNDRPWPTWVSEFKHSFGQSGIWGAFNNTFARFGPGYFADEVTSVIADVAARLDLARPTGRYLTEAEAEGFTDHLRDLWLDRDVGMGEALTVLPEPTARIGKRIVCFVTPTGLWYHLDFEAERLKFYDRERGDQNMRDNELLLRNIRVPAPTFDQSLILTMYGRYRRWGPASWIDQPPRRDDKPDNAAIAAKLRAVRDRDPSQ